MSCEHRDEGTCARCRLEQCELQIYTGLKIEGKLRSLIEHAMNDHAAEAASRALREAFKEAAKIARATPEPSRGRCLEQSLMRDEIVFALVARAVEDKP